MKRYVKYAYYNAYFILFLFQVGQRTTSGSLEVTAHQQRTGIEPNANYMALVPANLRLLIKMKYKYALKVIQQIYLKTF